MTAAHRCQITGNTFHWNVECLCGWVCANLATKGEAERERDSHLADSPAARSCTKCGYKGNARPCPDADCPTRSAATPQFGVRIARGLVTYWQDVPLTTWELADECRQAIEKFTGERGEVEEVLLSVKL